MITIFKEVYVQNQLEYNSLADLVGVKFDNDKSDTSSSHGAPSSGMISARRRANMEIAKKIQQDVTKS